MIYHPYADWLGIPWNFRLNILFSQLEGKGSLRPIVDKAIYGIYIFHRICRCRSHRLQPYFVANLCHFNSLAITLAKYMD